MRDDVLGLFGDPTCTGKPATDDLREGKRTVLVERALALATPAQRAVLSDGLGDPLLDDEGAARCRDVVAATGALASVEAFVRDRHAAALDAVRDVPEPARGRSGRWPRWPSSGIADVDTAVVLFNRDLRVHDHPALHDAVHLAERVVPLFVLDDDQPVAPNRLAFLLESLRDLRNRLRERGGELVVRSGDPVDEALAVAAEVGAGAVLVSGDVTARGTEREQRLAKACADAGIQFLVRPGVTVVPPHELRPADGDHYKVFTPYWRAWRNARWRTALRPPPRVPGATPAAARPAPGAGRARRRRAVAGPPARRRDGGAGPAPLVGRGRTRPVRRRSRRSGRRPHVPREPLPPLRLRVAARAGRPLR